MPYPRSASVKGARTIRERAHSAYADVRDLVRRLHTKRLSYAQIADALNQKGYRTRRGGLYKPMQVWRVLKFYCDDHPEEPSHVLSSDVDP